MGKDYSTKIHIAKRELGTLCHKCKEPIQKGEKYTKHQGKYIEYFVEHVTCPRDRKVRSKEKIRNQFYSMKKEWERKYPNLIISTKNWVGEYIDFDIQPKKDLKQKHKFTAYYDEFERRYDFYDRTTDTKIPQHFGWMVRYIATNWGRYK